MAAVVPEQIADENNREVYAGKRRGPAGTDDAHGGSAPFAVNENPVKERVDDVCGDQREGDRPDQVHGLDAAADSEIEEQGKESDQKSAAEEGNDVEEVGTDADGADGAGALRKMADHDGIDDAHGHPADLGKDEREGEAHSWAQLAAKCSEADHGSEWLLEV